MELIDNILKEQDKVDTQASVMIDGVEHIGWVCAKPLNYNYENGFFTRLRNALKIIKGKAIAIQYFEDLSENEKINYVRKEKQY
jgi:hypothetical protein